MSLNAVQQLILHDDDPRDQRVLRRIEEELEPLAEDIVEEYREGYTEQEVKELAAEREKRENRRERARERQQEQRSAHAEKVRREQREEREPVVQRLLELTSAGPVRWGEIRDLLAREGIDSTDVYDCRGDGRLHFDEDAGGRVYIERAS